MNNSINTEKEDTRMKECRYCEGTGEVEVYTEGYPKGRKTKCEACKGFGKIYVAIRQV